MVITFFVEYHYPSTQDVEKKFKKLAKLYLRGKFSLDLIAIIPFYAIFKGTIDEKYNRLFYLLKLVRLSRAFELMSTKVFMTEVKSHFNMKLENLIKNHEKLA